MNNPQENPSVRSLRTIINSALAENEKDFDRLAVAGTPDKEVLAILESIIVTAFRNAGIRVETKYTANIFELELSEEDMKAILSGENEFISHTELGHYKGDSAGYKNTDLITWRLHVRRKPDGKVVFELENCKKLIAHELGLLERSQAILAEIDANQ